MKGEGKPQIKEVSTIKELKGLCAVCGKRAILGNELCVNCWDENDGTYPAPTRREFFTILKRVCRKIK